jgi:hypothetical protein
MIHRLLRQRVMARLAGFSRRTDMQLTVCLPPVELLQRHCARGLGDRRQPEHLFVENEVPPLTVGLARRALSMS